MSKTFKVQKAHRVHKELRDPTIPHPIHGTSPQRVYDWMTCGERHAEAGRKVKSRKSRRMKEKEETAQDILETA